MSRERIFADQLSLQRRTDVINGVLFTISLQELLS